MSLELIVDEDSPSLVSRVAGYITSLIDVYWSRLAVQTCCLLLCCLGYAVLLLHARFIPLLVDLQIYTYIPTPYISLYMYT